MPQPTASGTVFSLALALKGHETMEQHATAIQLFTHVDVGQSGISANII
jgi:hypothetical protein